MTTSDSIDEDTNANNQVNNQVLCFVLYYLMPCGTFKGLEIWHGNFLEITCCPGIFLVLIFAAIRSSTSLVIHSTPPPPTPTSPVSVVQSTNDFFPYYLELRELRIRIELGRWDDELDNLRVN